jgi:hypothetical protein
MVASALIVPAALGKVSTTTVPLICETQPAVFNARTEYDPIVAFNPKLILNPVP